MLSVIFCYYSNGKSLINTRLYHVGNSSNKSIAGISLKMIFSLKNVGKACLQVVEGFDILVPGLRAKNDVKLCLNTSVTLCPNMDERCRHKKYPPLFSLVGLRHFGASFGKGPKID